MLVLAFILTIVMAGAVYAADQPATGDDNSTAALASTSATDAAQVEPAKAEDQNADADKPEKKSTRFGLAVGIYSPMDSEVDDVFGGDSLRLGIRPLPGDIPRNWRPSFDISYYSMSHDGNKAQLIPITFGVFRGFGKDNVQSYAEAHAGPFFGNVNAPSIGVDKSGVGLNVNATLGVILSERICLEGRYDYMSDFGGLDFSSLSFSVAIGLFKMKM